MESSKKHHPSLYKRNFLIYLDNGRFKPADDSEKLFEVSREDKPSPEEIAKIVTGEYFGVKLEKMKLNIFGKYKEFDFVNIEDAMFHPLSLVQSQNASGLWKSLNS